MKKQSKREGSNCISMGMLIISNIKDFLTECVLAVKSWKIFLFLFICFLYITGTYKALNNKNAVKFL